MVGAVREADQPTLDGSILSSVGAPRRLGRTAAYMLAVAIVVAAGAAVTIPRSTPPFTSYRAGRTIPIAVTPAVEYQPAISPDGKLVAFAGATPDGFRIFVRQIDGGRSLLLTGDLAGTHIAPKWSPDQTRILFEATVGESPAAAYVVPALGGTPRRIVTSPIGGVSTPAWSPSGSEIAYADDEGIWVQPVEGGARKRVVGGQSPHSPAWSPDGLRLAFVEGVPQTLDNVSTTTIRIVRVDGGPAVDLSDGSGAASSPVWAPDGKSVLFVGNAAGVADIYQQPLWNDGAAAGPPDRLTVGLSPMTISMAADGRRLAYDALRRESTIWMSRVGGNTGTAVQITREKESIECLSLSHDGNWLAYDSNREGSFDDYKLRVAGGEPVRLTSNPANEFCPAWSADDSEIAFHSARHQVRDIFTVKADGGIDTTAIADSLEKFEPWWSGDGRRLTYFVLRASGGEPARGDVMVVERDTRGEWSRPRTLIQGVAPNVAAAPWSPRTDEVLVGGTALLAISARDGSRRVLVDSATLNGNADWPKWSPDGSTVYFHYTRPTGAGFVSMLASRTLGGSPTGFMALPAAGGAPRTVVGEVPSRPAFRGQFATDGQRFFFTSPNVESDVHVLEMNARPGRRD
jgi:TolB protein